MSFQEYCDSAKFKMRLGSMNSKLVIGVIFIAVLAIAVSLFTCFSTTQAYSEEDQEVVIEKMQNSESEEISTSDSVNEGSSSNRASIFIHVTGCVKNPGVYELDQNDRANKAIEAAGGFTKQADKDAINLAQSISDGQQIIVPKKASTTKASTSITSTSTSDSGASTDSFVSNSTLNESSPNQKLNNESSLININSASSEQLQTLSGIGEAKAQKIIDYRDQNGAFKSVDELTNVSGIGEKTLESIRNYICV